MTVEGRGDGEHALFFLALVWIVGCGDASFLLEMIRILFIGDVVGRPGRRVIRELLPALRLELQLDFVVANGENSAGGAGITRKTARELLDAGVDVITSGDHLWDERDVLLLMEEQSAFLRPLNYPPNTPGKGGATFAIDKGHRIGVVNLQGRTFMPALENPFTCVTPVLEDIRKQTPVILVDFHAEATSEKIAMGWMLDGQVSLVVGTHTHVQTADEQILPQGTAFLCDAGFTGAQTGVLGRDAKPVIERFLTSQPRRFTLASQGLMLKGVVIEVDPESGRATHISRLSRSLDVSDPAQEEKGVS